MPHEARTLRAGIADGHRLDVRDVAPVTKVPYIPPHLHLTGTTMAESPTRILSRVAALVAGLAVFAVASLFSFGVALCSPLGIWAVHRFQRSRGRSLDGWGIWMSSVGSAVVGVLLLAGVAWSLIPAGTWSRARQAADSASAVTRTQPPPAWLDRIAPGAAARASMSRSTRSPATNTLTLILGAWFVAGIFGGMIGTAGWIGSMLIVFSVTGDWLHRAPPVTVEPAIPGAS